MTCCLPCPGAHRLALLGVLLLPTLAPTLTHAADPASRIERVTVYPGLALVERVARVPAGSRELVLDCLSASFDMSSLQIDAADGVRLGPVSAHTRPRAEVSDCDSSPLDGRIRSLEDRIAGLNAEHGGHELVLGYLRALAPADPASAVRSNPLPANAASLGSTLGAIQRAGQDAWNQQHRLGRDREALERELQPLLAERERLRQQSGQVRQLRIALASPREASLRLRYQVPGPSWAPAYRATLDAQVGSVQVERLAQVSQRSGEDWTGVKLALSTGSPRSATAGPEPQPWQISPRPAVQPAYRSKTMAAPPVALAMAAPSPEFKQADAAADAEPDFTVQVSEGEFATAFEVPGTVDVGSGGQRVSLSLGSHKLPATVLVRSVPATDPSAWLMAELTRPEGVWPDGPMQLLRGTQVVGQSVWRSGSQEKMLLPFGRDELVRVRAQPSQQQTGSAGFIGSQQERRVGQVYQIENRHRSAIELLVLEASPVGSDEQIQVTRQFNPAPLPGHWQDLPGVVAWRQSLPAGQTARFSADYSIRYPKDMQVIEQR